MPELNRRQFLQAASGAAAAPAVAAGVSDTGDPGSAIDFRYAPLSGQTAFCFPDDPYKSLVGERGELRYADATVEFSVLGMEPNLVGGQRLESPRVPVVHTRIDRPEAYIELTAFATTRPGEGRVDNVLLEIRPRTARTVYAIPQIVIRSQRAAEARGNSVFLAGANSPLLIATEPLKGRGSFTLKEGAATAEEPYRIFVRLPQEGQAEDRLAAGLRAPEALLEEARAAWTAGWQPFGESVKWSIPGRYGEFLVACARNIMQAREIRNGRLTYQVGPTVYRGLWIVDGNFILEAASYLGDNSLWGGVEAIWAKQDPDGGIFAGAGREHWKDSGIAIFTLVRQCELFGNTEYFRKMRPQVLRAAEFLRGLRDRARSEQSANGRYSLLPRGMGDGGLGGIRSEFTNTLWAVAGLKAATEFAALHKLEGFEPVQQLYRELHTALFTAMRQEMRRHPAGFDYLPMLMREDSQWSAANDREQPRPQTGQWALSHAIYPGLLFAKDDPVVRGHIGLMQACTQEDIPAETGWLPHEGLWTYNAAFVAHAYLWAGLSEWARLTFHGFLNHATPLYCWREEQPLRGSLAAGYVGDMPHNWASAECVLYLRHMLALEDGRSLRLLAGFADSNTAFREPYSIAGSPTRFGRISLSIEPGPRSQMRVRFERAGGTAPAAVEVPAHVGKLHFDVFKGAASKQDGTRILADPEARSWDALYVS
jgi:hypothetical protein